ncbi:MAG TPA: MaoC family dehydratase [Pseudonocardia sp.]
MSAPSFQVGQTRVAVVVEQLSRTQLVQYAGASGDYNPLHSDEVYATQAAGHRSVFAHGMLTMGATARVVTDWVGDGNLLRYGVRFLRQVWPGDRLTATATVTEVRDDRTGRVVEIAVVTINQDGAEVVTGYATAKVGIHREEADAGQAPA